MNNDLKKMIDEFTTKYSELFIETFLIKYINDYDMKDFSDALEYAYIKLENKLKKNINLKLKELEKNKKED